MDQYLGALVKLTRPVTRGDGLTISGQEILVVTGHWRGKLTLSFRKTGTLGTPPGDVAVRHIDRKYVQVRWQKLA
jgi:hypothetical protein